MGPCFKLGELVRETPQFYVYQKPDQVWATGRLQFPRKKVKKKAHNTHIHLEPCTRCVDHPETDYP